ncbi:MAG TPA: AAA family ATPase [Candidatus Paceibacterota bacterium]|nr:AAA family ATPase [Candidatus Paceibacterota bacterium]
MIIGVTGTNGAGKGTVVDYLVAKGFTHYSVREFLIEEIKRRGMEVNRPSMREVANDLRASKEPEFIVDTLFTRATKQGGDAVIESIRALREAEFLKKHGAHLFAVDANRHIRYERVVLRASHTDAVDFDTWVMEEEREWHNEAAHDMNVPGVMKLADHTFHNDGTLEELHAQIDAVLAKLA